MCAQAAPLPPPPPLVRLLGRALDVLSERLHEQLVAAGFDDHRMSHDKVMPHIPPGGITLAELSRRAGITKQAMAELVQYLEAHGYVTRVPNPTDGRAKLVLPTERGLDVIAIAQAAAPELENQILELIGAARMRTLRDDLETIRRAITSKQQ